MSNANAQVPQGSRINQVRTYVEKNENKIAVGFFIGGFIFDIVMLDRIDSAMMIGQQIFYLIVILAALMQMFFEQSRPPLDIQNMFFLKRWYYEYRTAIIHFFFGSLLNLYTIFFFKSSSLLVSFGFMVALVALLAANESNRFKSAGLKLKFSMLAICLLSFFSYIIPIIFGMMGTMVFLFSMLIGSLPLVGIGWWIQTYRETFFEQAKKQILLPLGLVLAVFLSLYLFRLIPPVPMSLPFIGVYHSVERTAEGYKLGHERPWWKFWHNGDQTFLAQRADKIYVAFRVFSPANFSDQVLVRWYWKDNRQGWVLQDSIPIKIVGGREEGFRGYGVKANYQPGQWRVQIETTDEREIGRIYFNLEIAPEQPRTLEFDLM